MCLSNVKLVNPAKWKRQIAYKIMLQPDSDHKQWYQFWKRIKLQPMFFKDRIPTKTLEKQDAKLPKNLDKFPYTPGFHAFVKKAVLNKYMKSYKYSDYKYRNAVLVTVLLEQIVAEGTETLFTQGTEHNKTVVGLKQTVLWVNKIIYKNQE